MEGHKDFEELLTSTDTEQGDGSSAAIARACEAGVEAPRTKPFPGLRKGGLLVAALSALALFAVAASRVSGRGLQHRLPQGGSMEHGVGLSADPCARLLTPNGAEAKALPDGHPCKIPMSKELHKMLRTRDNSTARSCSEDREDCSHAKCCSGEGMQCYQKSEGRALCRASCIPGPDPTDMDGSPWSCRTLGRRAPGAIPKCGAAGDDCRRSQCCSVPGMQCYQKDSGFATCKATCTKGLDLTDPSPAPWTCKPLGHRARGAAAWVAKNCSGSNQKCTEKMCCSEVGMQCYEKDAYYGECRLKCPTGWGCKTRGSRTPQPPVQSWQNKAKVAKWVADKCAKPGEDCRKSTCCTSPGDQCVEKNATWSTCKGSCAPGPDLYDVDSKPWSCKALGPRTPGPITGPWKKGAKVSKWVAAKCSGKNKDCRHSQCCSGAGMQCFRKDKLWAACMTGCTKGKMPGDDGKPWSCEKLGPRTHRPWGKPSLFCFSVVQPMSPEVALMKAQIATGQGIFGCDEYAALSRDRFSLGFGPLGLVETLKFIPAAVVQSKDGTAGNAELFMHAWDAVNQDGRFRNADWTVKADPDAVVLAHRLRWHLAPHTGKSVYIVNCDKPYMPEGPMMFGALEAISTPAIETYFAKAGDCAGGLPWKSWGEDWYMGKCLQKLGVAKLQDFKIYQDGVCKGVDCQDPDAAAFHPFKDVNSWLRCLNLTKSPVRKTTPPPPQWKLDYMKSYRR